MTASVTDRVRAALDRIRPAVEMDGGGLELVAVDEPTGTVTVALTGACAGCANSSSTMQLGVERTLRALVPEVRAVEAVAIEAA